MPSQWFKPDETCCDRWGCDLMFHSRVLVTVVTELLNKENGKYAVNTNFNAVNSILPAYSFVVYMKPCSLAWAAQVFGGSLSRTWKPGPYFRTKSAIFHNAVFQTWAENHSFNTWPQLTRIGFYLHKHVWKATNLPMLLRKKESSF